MPKFNCPTCGTTLPTVAAVDGDPVCCDGCRADVAIPASAAEFSSHSIPAQLARPQWSDWPDDEDARPKPRSIVKASWNPWLVLLVLLSPFLVCGAGMIWYYLQPGVGESLAAADLSRSRMLTAACETYKNNNGDWPPNLEVLAQEQPNGDHPIIELKLLKPSCGPQFRFDPTGPNNGGKTPDIWVDTPRGPIGNWMTNPPR